MLGPKVGAGTRGGTKGGCWDQRWVLGPEVGAGTRGGCWDQRWVLGPKVGAGTKIHLESGRCAMLVHNL